MAEEWRPVVGYEGLYEVSDTGHVRRDGRILKPCLIAGYPTLSLFRAGVGRSKSVHRLVLEAFVGTAPEGTEANHKDGVRDNACLSNLEWVTHSENMKHSYAVLKRRTNFVPGSEHPLAKVTEDQVMEILRLGRLGYTQRELGRQFGLHWTSIGHILNGTKWTWLTNPAKEGAQ